MAQDYLVAVSKADIDRAREVLRAFTPKAVEAVDEWAREQYSGEFSFWSPEFCGVLLNKNHAAILLMGLKQKINPISSLRSLTATLILETRKGGM